MALQLPTMAAKHLLDITPELLRTMGVKAVLLDVDNTLSHHGAPVPFAGTIPWVEQMKNAGFRLMIVSNNTERRIAPFAGQFGLPFIWRACKPLPIGYWKAAKRLGVRHRETVIIGDQIYTDVVGANLIGMRSVLVEPAEEEHGWSFRVRRHFEKSVRRKIQSRGLYYTPEASGKGETTT